MTIKNLNGLSILVIDDEIVWGRLLERTFENAGCRALVNCAAASNWQNFISLIILLDFT